MNNTLTMIAIVVAALLAWVLLREPLTWLQGVGGIITLAGIGVASGTLNRGVPVGAKH